MRFAVLSDIQANLVALEAVLRDIDIASPPVDRIFSAGDLVGRGPRPNEVMMLCRERGIDGVMGNYDDAVAFDRLGSGADFGTEVAERDDARALMWTKQTLTDDNMETLQGTPRDLRLYTAGRGGDIKRNTGDVRRTDDQHTFRSRFTLGTLLSERRPPGPRRVKEVLLVHGTPRAYNEFVREDSANSILERIVGDARADVLITGHSASAFRRDFRATAVVGVGSVSGAQTRPGRATYVILEIGHGVEVDVRIVDYDPAPYVDDMQARGLPMYAPFVWPL